MGLFLYYLIYDSGHHTLHDHVNVGGLLQCNDAIEGKLH